MVAKRLRFFALAGVLGGLGLSACKQTTETPTVVSGEEPAKVAAKVAETPAVETGSADARAKALGYAQYLPKDTQAYFAVYDGKGFVQSILDSKLGSYVQKMASEQGGVDLAEITEEPQAQMALSLLAEEFFFAVGPGAGKQVHNLSLLNEVANYEQMKFLVTMLDAELTGKEADSSMMMQEMMMMPMLGGIMGDPRTCLELFEKSQMPPLTIGVKISDEEMRTNVSGMLAGGLMEFLGEVGPEGEDIAAPLEVKLGEVTFTGFKVLGEKLAKKLDEEAREDMADILDAASIERLIKIIGEKNAVVATGVHGDYILLFAGSDAEELQIAASPAESLAANPKLGCVDAYLDKTLLSVAMFDQEVMNGLTKDTTSLGAMARGIKAGLGESEGFGDTRDLEVLLDLVAKQEKELLALTKYYDAGMVAYREDGLKIEGFGCTNGAGAKLDAPHTYGSLAERDNVLMFANWVADEDYSEKTMAYLDTIGETLYLGAKRFSNLEIEDGDMEEFQGAFAMFDEKVRPDMLELWKALREDLGKGLGGETALIVDVNGGLPAVPGIPQEIVDEGKAPRIGLIKPVADRESIGTSWKRINTSMEGLLKTISEMGELDIPMQKPMSSEKDDLQTWFFTTIPFQSDDFVLSVSIDEKSFYASTSKSFVQEISASLADATPDPARTGGHMTFDFNVLRSYLANWIEMADKHAAALVGDDPDAIAQVRGMLPMAREALAAFEDLDTVKAHTRLESGKLRGSLHFKVK